MSELISVRQILAEYASNEYSAELLLKHAIEHLKMAQQQAEPVEYQRRMRPLWDSQVVWTPWEKCTKGTYEDCIRVPVLHDWEHQVRALYTAKQAKPAPIPTSDRLPTEADADADCDGRVWVYGLDKNRWIMTHWMNARRGDYWLPTGLKMPPAPGGEG